MVFYLNSVKKPTLIKYRDEGILLAEIYAVLWLCGKGPTT